MTDFKHMYSTAHYPALLFPLPILFTATVLKRPIQFTDLQLSSSSPSFHFPTYQCQKLGGA